MISSHSKKYIKIQNAKYQIHQLDITALNTFHCFEYFFNERMFIYNIRSLVESKFTFLHIPSLSESTQKI